MRFDKYFPLNSCAEIPIRSNRSLMVRAQIELASAWSRIGTAIGTCRAAGNARGGRKNGNLPHPAPFPDKAEDVVVPSRAAERAGPSGCAADGASGAPVPGRSVTRAAARAHRGSTACESTREQARAGCRAARRAATGCSRIPGARREWCRLSDSNRRPAAYKAAALPAELSRRVPGRDPATRISVPGAAQARAVLQTSKPRPRGGRGRARETGDACGLGSGGTAGPRDRRRPALTCA